MARDGWPLEESPEKGSSMLSACDGRFLLRDALATFLNFAPFLKTPLSAFELELELELVVMPHVRIVD